MNQLYYSFGLVIFSRLINCSPTFGILLPKFRPTAAYPSGLPPKTNGYSSLFSGNYYDSYHQAYGYINPLRPNNASPYTGSEYNILISYTYGIIYITCSVDFKEISELHISLRQVSRLSV